MTGISTSSSLGTCALMLRFPGHIRVATVVIGHRGPRAAGGCEVPMPPCRCPCPVGVDLGGDGPAMSLGFPMRVRGVKTQPQR